MRSYFQSRLQSLWSVFRTPDVGSTQPKQLLLIQLKPRKHGLDAHSLNTPFIGLVGLFDASVVSNIFALSRDSVELSLEFRHRVVAILLDNALGFLDKTVQGCLTPPIGQVSFRQVEFLI